ncbi:MAG: hypothetical protein ACRDNB_06310 [Gaiellaceae bacterium]
MAAKRVDPLKAKAAKQKKIAIGGAVLLLALLAYQGPKTMKMLQGPQAIEPPAAATTTPAPSAEVPVVGAETTPGAAAPGAGTDLASVADSDAAPTPEQGQLATFERFASKDPFAQQAQPVPAKQVPTDPKDDEKADADKESEDKPAGEDSGSDGGFTSGDPAPPKPVENATATSISVNGVAEDVALEASFPKDEPTFVLVSVAEDGKSVQIGIAGGEYATGGETMKLGLGKKLTLQNTADGSRYEVELLTIAGFPLPKPKK